MNQLSNTKLFHVSEEQDIEKFIPRYSPHTNKPVVWAISEDKLASYLLPRDCPRISYYAGNKTSEVDIKEFLGSSKQVIAIEAMWYKQAIATRLYLYELPTAIFNLFDSIAGYYIVDTPVIPICKHIIDDPIKELLAKKIELRILPSLWQLHDAVVNSTLEFSIIRMKNSQARILSRT